MTGTIRTVARKEFIDLVRDGRFRWCAAVVFVLLLLSLAAGARHRADAHHQQESARREERRTWLEQGEKNPHAAAHQGMYAFNPSPLLSAFDRGVSPYVGSVIWMEAHKQNDGIYRPVQDATEIQRFGELSAAMILQLLVPLLIVFMTFSSVAGERERGTLRQVLSLGVRPWHLIAGKALGTAAVLGRVLGGAALFGVAALLLVAADEFAPALPRMAVLAVFYGVYLLVFLMISLAVSAAARTSRQALVILLGFWIFNALIAPKLAAGVAGWMVPTPSAFEFEEEIARLRKEARERGVDGHNMDHPGTKALVEKLLAQYGAQRLEDLPVNFRGIALAEGERTGNAIYDRVFGKLWSDYEAQARIQQWLGLAAPVLSMRALSMAAAGTDFFQYRHFATAAEAHRRRFIETINDDITHNSRYGENYTPGREVWEKAPAFEYEPPGAGWALANVWPAAASLLLWLAAGFASLAAGARRMTAEGTRRRFVAAARPAGAEPGPEPAAAVTGR